jgi:hypothetical protein
VFQQRLSPQRNTWQQPRFTTRCITRMAFWALSRAGTFSTRPVAFLFCSFIMQRRLFHHNDTTVCILVRLHFWQKEVYSMAGKPAGDRVGFYFFSSAGRSGVCRKGEGKPKSV